MLTRKELEGIMGCKLTDEQWKEINQTLNNIIEREWEESHPMDE